MTDHDIILIYKVLRNLLNSLVLAITNAEADAVL